MSRHRRYALLIPLVVSSVALSPAMAARAAPSAPSAPLPTALTKASPTCKLQVAPDTNPAEFDLVLNGFRPNSQVRISGPKFFKGVVNNQGAFTEDNVPRGNYTVTTGEDRRGNKLKIGCEKPPRLPVPAALNITDADAAVSSPTGPVNCAVGQAVKFEGKLTGTGTGTVKYVWTSSTGKRTEASVTFNGPSTATTSFTVTARARQSNAARAPRVTVQLTVPKQGAEAGISSERVRFVLQCQ